MIRKEKKKFKNAKSYSLCVQRTIQLTSITVAINTGMCLNITPVNLIIKLIRPIINITSYKFPHFVRPGNFVSLRQYTQNRLVSPSFNKSRQIWISANI